MAELYWHVDALADLEAIYAFIVRDSAVSESQFTVRILGAAERLREHPMLGRVVPEIGHPALHEMIFQNYRLVYRLADDGVTVLGVIHGAMDLDRQAARRSWDVT